MIPENANESCPGAESSQAGKNKACEGCPNKSACESGELKVVIL